MATITREKVACVIFGAPHEIPTNVLPTYADVMKAYINTRQQLTTENNKYPPFAEVSNKVCVDVELVWEKASLPTVTHGRVIEKLRSYNEKYKKILKPYKARKGNDKYKQQLEQFREDADKLFDISKCKCVDFLMSCKCKRADKVPLSERDFLVDQRGARKMIIGGIDLMETKRLQKKISRKESESRRHSDSIQQEQSKQQCNSRSYNVEDKDDDTDTSDEDDTLSKSHCKHDLPTPESKRQKMAMTVRLPSLAKACDRTGVSDRAAAIIASSVLQDMGIVSPNDTSKVIDRSKIRRERSRTRQELTKLDSDSSMTCFPGLYFDGRKDKTLKNVRDAARHGHRDRVTEEHVSIICEPGSSYFGHVMPSSGSSKAISKAIFECLTVRSVDLDSVKVVGCDGTAVNTGHNGGVIRQFEELLQKPLQWLVCLLHTNELLLRHLFHHLDGATTGPKCFSGPIGKALTACTELHITSYEPIPLLQPLPHVDVKDLSTDQQYLWQMCQAVSKGHCPCDLALRKPGLMNHSRWLTTANRILRLYVGLDTPSNNIKTLVTFIIRVYAPTWFAIKTQPSCKDGAKHLHGMMVRTRYLSSSLKKVIDPVIQRNGFYGHPENVLLAMITDERPHIRELGLRRIMKARSHVSANKIRRFQVPPLNLNATEYHDMVDWQTLTVTEPPVMMDMTNNELKDMISAQISPSVIFPRFPCHTQAVERCVKLVTEASAAVCGETSRHGFIRARIASRQLMPKLETKSDYKF